jgi:hypothetical protein
MTLVQLDDSRDRGPHVGELRLRRFRLGELAGADRDEIARHTGECGTCRARLKTLEDEQRQFERELPFERFAGGVERAQRVPRVYPRRAWTAAAVGFAAAAALVLAFRPADEGGERGPGRGSNHIKGLGVGTLRIGMADGSGQRSAALRRTEALRAGERVRLGYRTEGPAHLVAISIDDAGNVSPLYPAQPGPGLAVEPREQVTYLPDSIDFDGKGQERVFLLLAERPLHVDEVSRAARAAHARTRGDLKALSSVPLEGHGQITQYTWLLEKP